MTASPESMQSRPQAASPGWLRIANIVALAVMLVVNALANILPLGGIATGEISDMYPSLFTPAGYVFSVWGLIYVLLIAFVVYQVLPSQRNNPRLASVGYLFALSCVLNASWLFAWHYLLIELSLVLMVGLLLTLIAIYLRLGIGRQARQAARPGERLCVDLPFSVYLGWITVATVANLSIFLLDLGFDGGGAAPLITVLVVAVACFIGLLALRLRSDAAFALVLAWAFVGIAVARYPQVPTVAVAALLGAILLLILSVAGSWRGRSARPGNAAF